MPQASGTQVQEALIAEEPELVDRAEQAGIDVGEVIDAKLESLDGYGVPTIANFVASSLRQRLDAAEADVLKGILVGSRDRYGKDWPRRHSLVRSSGDHIEVSTWDGSLPSPDGDEETIPKGAIVSIRCEFDEEYESYQGRQLDSITPLDDADLVEKLSKVAIPPGDLSKRDEYEVVVVRGTIRFVNPQTIFESGEQQGDGPVMMPDERGELQPHLELALDQQGSTRIRVHLERQRYGRPIARMQDFGRMCADAFQSDRDPEGQAAFIQQGFQNREVIVVGNVNKYDTSRNDDGAINYVDIAATGLVEAPSDQTSLHDVSDTTEGDDTAFDETKETIEQYVELTGVDPGQLDVGLVNENLDLTVPDSVIEQALDAIESDDTGGDESSDDGDDGDDDTPPWAHYDEEIGMWSCVVGSCLASFADIDDLQAHVEDHHPDAINGGE